MNATALVDEKFPDKLDEASMWVKVTNQSNITKTNQTETGHARA